MFILRRITSGNLTRNTLIGESYVLITADRNPEDFEKSLGVLKCDEADVYGFISYNDGSRLMPLYKKSTYFVMVGNGRTFENISF